MKYSFAILLFIFPFFMGSAYNEEKPVPDITNTQNNGDENDDSMNNKVRIKIGDNTLSLATRLKGDLTHW